MGLKTVQKGGKGTELGGGPKMEQGSWQLLPPNVTPPFVSAVLQYSLTERRGPLIRRPQYCTTKPNILAKWLIISPVSRAFVWSPVVLSFKMEVEMANTTAIQALPRKVFDI